MGRKGGKKGGCGNETTLFHHRVDRVGRIEAGGTRELSVNGNVAGS